LPAKVLHHGATVLAQHISALGLHRCQVVLDEVGKE